MSCIIVHRISKSNQNIREEYKNKSIHVNISEDDNVFLLKYYWMSMALDDSLPTDHATLDIHVTHDYQLFLLFLQRKRINY